MASCMSKCLLGLQPEVTEFTDMQDIDINAVTGCKVTKCCPKFFTSDVLKPLRPSESVEIAMLQT